VFSCLHGVVGEIIRVAKEVTDPTPPFGHPSP
jgi:hypothetical protein